MARVTTARVQNLQKRVDAAALAARVAAEKRRGPVNDADRVDAVCAIVDKVQDAGGVGAALLERIAARFNEAPTFDDLSLLVGLRFPALWPHASAVLDGSGTMADYRAALHPLVAREQRGGRL